MGEDFMLYGTQQVFTYEMDYVCLGLRIINDGRIENTEGFAISTTLDDHTALIEGVNSTEIFIADDDCKCLFFN